MTTQRLSLVLAAGLAIGCFGAQQAGGVTSSQVHFLRNDPGAHVAVEPGVKFPFTSVIVGGEGFDAIASYNICGSFAFNPNSVPVDIDWGDGSKIAPFDKTQPTVHLHDPVTHGHFVDATHVEKRFTAGDFRATLRVDSTGAVCLNGGGRFPDRFGPGGDNPVPVTDTLDIHVHEPADISSVTVLANGKIANKNRVRMADSVVLHVVLGENAREGGFNVRLSTDDAGMAIVKLPASNTEDPRVHLIMKDSKSGDFSLKLLKKGLVTVTVQSGLTDVPVGSNRRADVGISVR
jgi:hypothetical protein